MAQSERQDLPVPMHSSETGGRGVNTVGIVGFGLVGRAMAALLVAAGHRAPGDDIAPGACTVVALVLADAVQPSRSTRTC